jgi:hypothetical protein
VEADAPQKDSPRNATGRLREGASLARNKRGGKVRGCAKNASRASAYFLRPGPQEKIRPLGNKTPSKKECKSKSCVQSVFRVLRLSRPRRATGSVLERQRAVFEAAYGGRVYCCGDAACKDKQERTAANAHAEGECADADRACARAPPASCLSGLGLG